MTHMRYWAMSLAVAVAGGFLATDRFAFASNHAVWIGFGVAIAASVFALAATGVALVRQNYTFSGLSGASAAVAGWTIIATRAFDTSSALWLAFAGGLALLLLSLRALALHETSVARVLHELQVNGAGKRAALRRGRAVAVSPVRAVAVSHADRMRDGLQSGGAMRSWIYWLVHTGVALAGGFIVVATFAWWSSAPHLLPPHLLPLGRGLAGASTYTSARWLAFGVGVAGASLTLSTLLERVLAARDDGRTAAGVAALVITAASAAVAIALIVLMAINVSHARWWAFGLGAGMIGASLAALIIHELSRERVRHELEIAHAITPIETLRADG